MGGNIKNLKNCVLLENVLITLKRLFLNFMTGKMMEKIT